MDIHQLKRSVFHDLDNPMGYLQDKGFTEPDTPPDSARLFGSSLYFYCNGAEWKVVTPECRVLSSSVNSFVHPTHALTLDVPKEWKRQMLEQLKQASQLAWEQKLLPMVSKHLDTFDEFWRLCNKPPMLSLEAHAYSRRGKKKEYLNLFHRGEEITGHVLLQEEARVKVSMKWSLSESEESGSFGWRAHFSSGIDICTFGGQPFVIRKPWSWEDLKVNQLVVPLHDSFVVKTPALCVAQVQGAVVRVEIENEKTKLFVEAVQALHQCMGKIAWDGCICIIGAKRARLDDVIVASIVPKLEGDTIAWYTQKIYISNNETRSAKRQCR
mgnify:FL=1